MANDQDQITANIKTDPLDSPQSDAAIADIVAKEADLVLAAEDAKSADQNLADASDQTYHRSHPFFWFIIAFFVILAVFLTYILVNPNL